jgi:hypothetical protein
MRFGILGPLEVWDGGQRLAVGGPQQRALLAVLLLQANQVVSVDRLVDHIWGDQPPVSARALLQGCVAGLRRALRVRAGERLLTRAPGYLLEVRPGELPTHALTIHGHARRAARHTADRIGEAHALRGLGAAHLNLARYEQAIDDYEQALALFRQAGDRTSEARALDNLGTVHTRLGQPGQATEYHREAITLFRDSDDRYGEAWALNGLGEAALAAGHGTDAVAHHIAALAAASETRGTDQLARAHAGLGHAHRTLGDLARAHRHYQRALAHYTDLSNPAADSIRAHLTGAGPATEPAFTI